MVAGRPVWKQTDNSKRKRPFPVGGMPIAKTPPGRGLPFKPLVLEFFRCCQ